MKKPFLVVSNPAPEFKAAVFAAGVVNPMELLDAVERELSAQGVTGEVLFDLLLSKGHKVQRYYLADFDGHKFQPESFISAMPRYAELSLLSAKMLAEHYPEVNPSLLSLAMQFALRKGFPL